MIYYFLLKHLFRKKYNDFKNFNKIIGEDRNAQIFKVILKILKLDKRWKKKFEELGSRTLSTLLLW